MHLPKRFLGPAMAALCFALLLLPAGAGAADDLPPVVHAAYPERLIVPSIGVDAPVVALSLDPDGAMPSPGGPRAVGWYSFSPTPGMPGNTVLSGHRDWRTGAAGVFWRLGELAAGDTITVQLDDGTEVTYAVLLSVVMAPDQMPIEEVVGQTADEIITLITCEGTFDRAERDYDQRRIVWAARVA